MSEIQANNRRPPPTTPVDSGRSSDGERRHLYGSRAQALLNGVRSRLDHHAPQVIQRFNRRVGELEMVSRLLERLPENSCKWWRWKQIKNLRLIVSPQLTHEGHRAAAIRTGRVHAIFGLDREDLVRGRDILLGALRECIDATVSRETWAVLVHRVNRDLAYQLEACEALQDARRRAVLEVTQLAWSAPSYAELIRQLVEILASLDEVAACAIGRPDHRGLLRFEAVSGERMVRYLAASEQSGHPISILADDPAGQGPAGHAWRSGKPERAFDVRTDPCMALWNEAARREGFRSSIAIPIRQPGHLPLAILSLYSPLPGAYGGASQRLFVDLIQTVLGFATARILATQGAAQTIPFGVRQRWIALMRSDALEMHYQPIMDLMCGSVKKVEVLARLRDGDRLVAPGEFLGVLSAEDYFALYVRGLTQALEQRNLWSRSGFDIGLSVNLPPRALQDTRYFHATREALEAFSCPASYLTLEVLETERMPAGMETREGFDKFKALGVWLAEDDLGSGHSSLARLNELPFDLVKIDRSIIGGVSRGVVDPLRFVYQLTRLGHSLGMSVVAEGVEDADLLPALRILGVDAVQGYAISRPLPAEKFSAWMRKQGCATHPQSGQNSFVELANLILCEERLVLSMRERTAEPPWQRHLAYAALRYGMRSREYQLTRARTAAAMDGP